MSVVEAVWMPESVEKTEAEEVEETKEEQKVETPAEEIKEA